MSNEQNTFLFPRVELWPPRQMLLGVYICMYTRHFATVLPEAWPRGQ